MDPVQTKLASLATETMEKLAAKAGKKQGAGAKLWEYVDPDGKKFWLEEKRVSVKSPFTGKTFSSKPQRATPASLGQEIREDSKMPSGPMGDKPMAVKKRKASDDGWGAEEHTAMEHATPESMKKYLHDHPGADPKNHSVKKTKLTPLQQSIKDDLDSRR